MARGVNKVVLIGNLGGDPETRYLPSGGAVTNITVATSESWKDKQTGQNQERTEWHRVVFFNRLAEIAGEYLRKGAKVYVEGSLRTRKWQDKDGADRYTTEIVANEMQMLDRMPNDGGADQQRQGNGGNNSQQRQSSGNQSRGQQQPSNNGGSTSNNQNQGRGRQESQGAGQYEHQEHHGQGAMAPASAGNFDDFDDDIPFRMD